MPHKGLSEKEILESRKKYGPNIFHKKKGILWLSIVFSQFKSPLIYIIIVVAVISALLKEYVDAELMLVVIALNVTLGFYQEYKAQKTLSAIKSIVRSQALVIRSGEIKRVDVEEVVVGDIIILNPGDKVPADGALFESINLLVNEAILTGESEAVLKSLNNHEKVVFMGTTVLSGHGTMKVLKVGQETEIGKISHSITTISDGETPLQKKLGRFSADLTYIIVSICILIFLFGIWSGQNAWDMLKISVILTVAAIPEGLPIAITVILARGMKRMANKNGVVKKLLAMETLGTTSVICTDKTGTLTEGNMVVVKTDFVDTKKAFLAMALTNEQKNNVEVAIWNYLKTRRDFDPQKVFNEKNTIYEEPFDSEKKYRLTVANVKGKEMGFVLGAPEIIIEFCKISRADRAKALKKIEKWATDGFRVLAVIYKDKGILSITSDYKWLGLIAIEDPIRKETKSTIKRALAAHIKVKIITGDYRKTAEHIAAKLGFKLKEKNIIEGDDLEMLSDEQLDEKIEDLLLFTRITPHQKLRIIDALQKKGEIVAMTGDGVNDAPALKKADVGIVVGSATDVAKESADLVLLDSNFKTILAACEEGRLIFSNIKKVVAYVLSNSFVEMVLILGAILLKLPAPLTIVQILWIHLICDGPPDIVLGFEPRRKELESEDPKNLKKEEILGGSMKFLVFAISFTTGILALASFYYFYHKNHDIVFAQTVVFASLAAVNLIYIFSFKDLETPLFKITKFFKNQYLLWGILYGFVLLFAGIYSPYIDHLLGTVPLKASDWLIVIGIGLVATFWVELVKYFNNKKRSYGKF